MFVGAWIRRRITLHPRQNFQVSRFKDGDSSAGVAGAEASDEVTDFTNFNVGCSYVLRLSEWPVIYSLSVAQLPPSKKIDTRTYSAKLCKGMC